MKKDIKYFYFLITILLAANASAQYIQVNDNYSAQQLVQELVGTSCAQVSNVSVSGWDGSSGGNSYGYFTAGTSSFPFSKGIILSTGFAASAPGPNSSLLSEGSTGWAGDQDLEQALDVNNTINATVLEFDFIPLTAHISFDYIFSSEQYLTSITSQNQCNYTDGFAFLLKEAGSSAPYQNLAVVPGTDIPVKVNTVRGEGVCPAANEQYFGGFNGTQHPTNFNGQTVILKAEANVIPGTLYHIKLVVADQGNNLYDSAIFLGGGSFNSTTSLGPDRTIAGGNPVCEDETEELDATTPNATAYKWYKDGFEIVGETNATLTVSEAGNYSVEVTIASSCLSEGEVTIEYSANPVSGNHTLLQCDEDGDGLAIFNILLADLLVNNGNPDLSVSYYSTLAGAQSNSSPITNLTAYQNTVPNQQVYARVQNQYGCYAVSTVTLATSVNGITNPGNLETCDTDGTDDGIYVFDLTQQDGVILQGLPANLELQYFTSGTDALASLNPITNPQAFINTVPGSQTIYARIYSGSECYGIAQFDIIVYSFGDDVANETTYLCSGGIAGLDAGSGYTSYKWDTAPAAGQILMVSQPGIYTVTVTNTFGCEGTKTFTVLQSGAATGATTNIADFAGSNNSITIYPEGPGDYEYSLDGIFYQGSPLFDGLDAGEYTIYIKDRNACGPVYRDTVYILDAPKYFTPNGDTFNDFWRIPYLQQRKGARVTIFDRYGRLLYSFTGATGWDGSFNGTPLPATDYWYIAELEDGRTVKGHFSLLR